jgi:folate-binding protein YgfZ
MSPSDQTRDRQYEVLSARAGYVPLGHRTQLELTGPDRARLLHNLCTNHILDLQPGDGCEAFVTNVRGKILGHVLVFCAEDSLTVDTVAGQADELISHLDKYAIQEDVEIHDRSQTWADLLVAGRELPELWESLALGPLPQAQYRQTAAEISGNPVAVRRVPMTAAPTLLVSGDTQTLDLLAESLSGAGAIACRPEPLETLRVEAGWPEYGRDITESNLPQEVNRDRQTLHFDKGCYLGQETVARIDAVGHVNWKLMGLQFSGPSVPAAGTELMHAGKTVGRVTSAVYSPRLNAPLAMGYVRREHEAPGTQLESALGDVQVVRLPLEETL